MKITYKLPNVMAFLMILAINIVADSINVKADDIVYNQQSIHIHLAELSDNSSIKVSKNNEVSNSSKSQDYSIVSRGEGLDVGNQVASYAYNFLGRPYVFGEAGPKAFDCSGLTRYVFARFGVNLPHYAGSQYSMGASVSRDNLKPGDLVFFNTYGSVSHVGIYVGRGDFIHAPSKGKSITISSLSEPYYSKRYVGARRIAE